MKKNSMSKKFTSFFIKSQNLKFFWRIFAIFFFGETSKISGKNKKLPARLINLLKKFFEFGISKLHFFLEIEDILLKRKFSNKRGKRI